jgi:hypothetical protein
MVHLRAASNDVFLLTDGGRLYALDGTSGELISAASAFPTPHFGGWGELKNWHAVSPDGDAKLLVFYSDLDGQGLNDPGIPSYAASGDSGVGCP